MSKFFSFCQTNTKNHQSKKVDALSSKTEKKIKKRNRNYCFIVSLFLLLLIFLVSGFHVFQITSSTTNGFKISKMEQGIDELKLINQELKDKVNSLENLDYVKNKAIKMGLVQLNEVEYLEAGVTNLSQATIYQTGH